MEIKYLKLTELKPYENNPRFNDQAVEAVANSIKEFGFINPIVIDKNNVVVAGHTRLKAAERLGLEKAPTIMVDNLSEEQINAFRIADNKVAELAEWDEGLLWKELQKIENIDMTQFGVDPNFYFEEEETVFEDFEPETIPDPRVQTGDIWKLGEHKLMCGSCTDQQQVLQLFGNEEADLVVTDPPYNVNYGDKANMLNEYIGGDRNTDYIANDSMEENEFIDFLGGAFNNINMVLKAGGAFYIFHASSSAYQFETAMKENNLIARQQLIWAKNTIVLGRQDYQWKHEPCFYGWKEGAGHYFIDDRTQATIYDKDIDLEKLSKQELIKLIQKERSQYESGTILHEDKPRANDLHPTMKPVNLCARLIRNSSKKGELVYDAFAGSGSTLIAAEQTGRKCYTIELDRHYCDVIIERWENLTGQKAELISRKEQQKCTKK